MLLLEPPLLLEDDDEGAKEEESLLTPPDDEEATAGAALMALLLKLLLLNGLKIPLAGGLATGTEDAVEEVEVDVDDVEDGAGSGFFSRSEQKLSKESSAGLVESSSMGFEVSWPLEGFPVASSLGSITVVEGVSEEATGSS